MSRHFGPSTTPGDTADVHCWSGSQLPATQPLISGMRSARTSAFNSAADVTLIDRLLAEQSSASAVELFARWHSDARPAPEPTITSAAPRYQRLMPAAAPRPGEQYAFEVDLARCTGCKACVAACHSLNGLDAAESWRQVGELVGTRGADGAPHASQTITTSCHHCEDPACANGCPVLAYEKDAVTGIVRHLDDQCIGCSYCVLKCPYEAPKYNKRRGIVRKCDMCQQRLAAGEAPACVQACPTSAITIRIVKSGQAMDAETRLLPGAFPSIHTRPTTRFVGGLLDAKAGAHAVQPADLPVPGLDPAHPPLTTLLVMSQMAIGAVCMAAVDTFTVPVASAKAPLLIAATISAWLGLAASILHLGQPAKAWRIWLGWRRSWLSREAVVLGAFASLIAAGAIDAVLASTSVNRWLLGGAMATALGGLVASAMVYADTHRPFWSARLVGGKFGATSVVLGAGLAATVWAWQGVAAASWVATGAAAVQGVAAAWERAETRRALADPRSAWHQSARVMHHHQRRWLTARGWLLAAAGVLSMAGAWGGSSPDPWILTAALTATTAAHFIERHLFFTAGAGPRMPGLA